METTRHTALDEIGSLDAPPGTRPWAIALRMKTQAALKDERSSAGHLRRLMELLREHKGYLCLADESGEQFPTFESFCRAPMPFGLGYDLDAINGIIEERKSAQARAAEPKSIGQHGGDHRTIQPEQGSQRTLNERGETSDYLTARIARDHPAILDRMKAGEFRSVRAAAKAAGIVAERWSVPTDPESAGRYLARRLSHDDWLRLKAEGDRQFGGE